MKFKKSNIKLYTAITSFCFSLVFSNQVQLITTHKKNNGTLLRIVTSKILEIENIIGCILILMAVIFSQLAPEINKAKYKL